MPTITVERAVAAGRTAKSRSRTRARVAPNRPSRYAAARTTATTRAGTPLATRRLRSLRLRVFTASSSDRQQRDLGRDAEAHRQDARAEAGGHEEVAPVLPHVADRIAPAAAPGPDEPAQERQGPPTPPGGGRA